MKYIIIILFLTVATCNHYNKYVIMSENGTGLTKDTILSKLSPKHFYDSLKGKETKFNKYATADKLHYFHDKLDSNYYHDRDSTRAAIEAEFANDQRTRVCYVDIPDSTEETMSISDLYAMFKKSDTATIHKVIRLQAGGFCCAFPIVFIKVNKKTDTKYYYRIHETY